MLGVLLASAALAQWISAARQPPEPPRLEHRELGVLSLAVPANWTSSARDDVPLAAELRDTCIFTAGRDDGRQLLVARLPEAPARTAVEAMQQAMSLLLPRTADGLPIERSRVRRARIGPATGAVCEALTHQRQRKHFLVVLTLDGRQQFVVYLSRPVHSDSRQSRQAVLELRDDRILFDAILASVRIARWREPAANAALFPRPNTSAAGLWLAHVDQYGDSRTWLWAPEAEDGMLRCVRSRWTADTVELDPVHQLAPPQLLAERYWLIHERPPSPREMAEVWFGNVRVWQITLSSDPRQLAMLQEQVWLARIAPGRMMFLELTAEPAALRQTVLFARELIAAATTGASTDGSAEAQLQSLHAALALGQRLRASQTQLLEGGPVSEQEAFLVERDGHAVGWEIGRLSIDASGDSLSGGSVGAFGQTMRVRSRSHGQADASAYVQTRTLEQLGLDGQTQRAIVHRLELADGVLRFAVGHDGGPMRLVWEMAAPEPMLTPLASGRWPLHLFNDAAAPAIAWMRWGGSRPAPFELRRANEAATTEDGSIRIWVRPMFSAVSYPLTLDAGGRAVRYESLWEGAGSSGSQWHATQRVDLRTLRQRLPQAGDSIDQALRELERENDPPI